MRSSTRRQHPKTAAGSVTRALLAFGAASALVVGGLPQIASAAAAHPSDDTKPDLVESLAGFSELWKSSGVNDLHGEVLNADALKHNDEMTSWINQNASADQQFRALQNAQYDNDGKSYDQSVSIADGLGKRLGAIYVQGRQHGELPLTSALINSENGTTGAYVGTGAAKTHFSYPRPFLSVDPAAQSVAGDDAECSPALVNGSSLTGIRTKGIGPIDENGNLEITRVPVTTDTTHQFSDNDVVLNPGYGQKGICTGGAFPSGHTTTAYQAGLTLATLLPELAPEMLARTSEAGNNRIVLGVHYPLDIMGGRMNGEAALASRWADDDFRTKVLEPARAELVAYLEKGCGAALDTCIENDTAYSNTPYAGKQIPGGTAQQVTDRTSAVAVYKERMTYGFAKVGKSGQAASVPAKAESLLRTTFPDLTDDQRRAVLAQTEIESGYPLDTTATTKDGDTDASWQRLNLAAAMSAKVQVNLDQTVSVLSTGTTAEVVKEAPVVTPPDDNGNTGDTGDENPAPANDSKDQQPAEQEQNTATNQAAGESGKLARTGEEFAPLWIGAALLALGATTLVLRRRVSGHQR